MLCTLHFSVLQSSLTASFTYPFSSQALCQLLYSNTYVIPCTCTYTHGMLYQYVEYTHAIVHVCTCTCTLRDILTSVSFSSNPLASTTSSPVTSLVTATLPEVTRSITCPQSVATPPAWLRVSLGRAEVRFWRAAKALLWTVCML